MDEKKIFPLEYKASAGRYFLSLLVSVLVLLTVLCVCSLANSSESQPSQSINGIIAFMVVMCGYFTFTYPKHKISLREDGIEGPSAWRFPLDRTFFSYDDVDKIDNFEEWSPFGKLMRGCRIKSSDGRTMILNGFSDEDLREIVDVITQMTPLQKGYICPPQKSETLI